MQYTPHYNLNLPEGPDIVNPLIQDNPNYSAIDTALYNNKLRVVGSATHVKTGTNHAITLSDSDINQFKFVATGDYASGDTFTVDGVTVTARIADGSSIPSGAFKINSTVLCILDGTILNIINVAGEKAASDVSYNNAPIGLSATDVQDAIDEVADHELKYTDSYFQTMPSSTITITKPNSQPVIIMFKHVGGYYGMCGFWLGDQMIELFNNSNGNFTIGTSTATTVTYTSTLQYFRVATFGSKDVTVVQS